MERPGPENGIFYTPLEIAKYNDTIGKVEAGGGKNFYTDRIDEGISIDPNTGNIQRQGFAYWDQFNPFTSQDEATIQKLAEGKKAYINAQTVQAATKGADLDQLEKTLGNRTLTADNVHSLVRSSEREIINKPNEVESAQIQRGINADRIARQQLQESINQNQITNKRYDYQWKVAQMNDARDRAERLDDKADERRDRLDLLDRQDHRYSQEMQRYDKRRQKETIQSLIGGLASLGAAFAM